MTPRPSHDVPSQREPELPPGAPRCRLIGSIYVAGALETVELLVPMSSDLCL
jgi:hypothetical protein